MEEFIDIQRVKSICLHLLMMMFAETVTVVIERLKKLKAIEDLNLNLCHKIQNVHSLIDNIPH